MGRSQETFNKKEVRSKKEKKRKEKEQKRLARKEGGKGGNSLDDMIAYVDENGMLSSTPPDPTVKKEEIKPEDIEVNIPKRGLEKPDPIRRGVVTFFNDNKGFGFIRDTETKESIFVHVNNMVDEVRENNVVTFEIGKGPKGPTALNVKLSR